MTTTIVLLVILGAGFAWAYRQGKKTAHIEGMESDLEKTKKISEMDKDYDEDTADILSALRSANGSNAPSVLNKPPRDS
tara:strand:+ start:566 stop:802 length:237 start_codon:yes stop_codon:yes gene_type:complete